jgi:hypothetical protein
MSDCAAAELKAPVFAEVMNKPMHLSGMNAPGITFLRKVQSCSKNSRLRVDRRTFSEQCVMALIAGDRGLGRRAARAQSADLIAGKTPRVAPEGAQT